MISNCLGIPGCDSQFGGILKFGRGIWSTSFCDHFGVRPTTKVAEIKSNIMWLNIVSGSKTIDKYGVTVAYKLSRLMPASELTDCAALGNWYYWVMVPMWCSISKRFLPWFFLSEFNMLFYVSPCLIWLFLYTTFYADPLSVVSYLLMFFHCLSHLFLVPGCKC